MGILVQALDLQLAFLPIWVEDAGGKNLVLTYLRVISGRRLLVWWWFVWVFGVFSSFESSRNTEKSI